jgi:hypothetical protein
MSAPTAKKFFDKSEVEDLVKKKINLCLTRNLHLQKAPIGANINKFWSIMFVKGSLFVILAILF